MSSGSGHGSGGGGTRTPLVATLRSRPGVIRVGAPGASGDVLTIRVQSPEVWDVVRVEAPASEPVLSVKVRALEALLPDADFHDDFVMKLNGFEVIDEDQSLTEAGAVNGSTFLVTNRRRQPVR
jgi:hypothetical protein